MSRRQPQLDQLKAVPDPSDNQHTAPRKPERETFVVYRLPDDDEDASGEREFLLTLPIDADVERRIKRDYGAGSYRIERRRGGRYVSVYEFQVDEPLQRESEPEDVETILPDDFEERVARTVIKVLEARRIERAGEKAHRLNPSPSVLQQSQPTTTPVDPLDNLVRTVNTLKQLGVPIGETPKAKATETPKDEDDRVLLSLLKDGELRRRVTGSISSMVGGADAVDRHWVEVAADALERHPKLATRLIDLGERFFPKREDSDDGDDDAAASVEDRCTDYLLEKCAANEPVTLNDAPLRELATQSPDEYAELIAGLQALNAEEIISYFSDKFDGARLVLRTPHARGWVERLKEVAAAT
jgi:hypothetical protein